jgi:hypothetical protein
MSFGISAAAWTAIAIGASAGISVQQAKEQKRAAKKATQAAKIDATKTALQNRRSEVFAETEGQGRGQLGQISLAIDEEEDIDNVLSV